MGGSGAGGGGRPRGGRGGRSRTGAIASGSRGRNGWRDMVSCLIDSVWPMLREGFARACRKGGSQFSEAGLRLTCRRGDAYLCLYLHGEEKIQAGVIVQEQQWSNRQVLFVLAATGEEPLHWWLEMTEWGKKEFPGCGSLIFEGRPGLGRMPKVKVLRHVFEMEMEI